MRKNETGVTITVGSGFDMSAGGSTLLLKMKAPGGTEKDVVPTLNTSAKTIPVEQRVGDLAGLTQFEANESVDYLTLAGDIDEIGRWTAQIFFTAGSQLLKSTVTSFDVTP